MGKRKTKRKPQKKLKDKLDVQFKCVFCNHENSIECKIDSANKIGILGCKVCDVSWQCTVTYLDEPVDVYSAWIDACEDVNKEKRKKAAQKPGEARDDSRTPPPQSYSEDRLDPFDEDEDDDDDDDDDDY